MNLEPALHDVIDAGWCPHLAMLLQRREEVAPTLASFYGLGAQRNGWLFHRSRIDGADADRRGLTAAGLDVAALEAEGRMAFGEIRPDVTPDEWVQSWEPELERALARGFDAAWWAHFAMGPDEGVIERSDPFDRAWDARFRGRPCVSLCLFSVGDLAAPAQQAHLDRLAEMHDCVLVVERAAPSLVRTRGR